MALDRIAALRRTREVTLALCRTLTPEEWAAPSRAAGWSVQDVVAHMGAISHSAVSPGMYKILTSKNIERSNDVDVEARRRWAPGQVLDEYDKWGGRLVKLLALGQRRPLAVAPFKLAELGVYPMALIASAATFDNHTHLRCDIAPALDRPLPLPERETLAVVNEWALTGLPRMNKTRLSFMDRPVTITLDGPGGGSWTVLPPAGKKPGRIEPAPGSLPSAAQIIANPAEFAAWASGRTAWRDHDVKITGDEAYATRFLDAIRLV
ncbi:MAG TPA: maleylpyruvate isomerase family mycothiol-dependent enzyme [Acidimicrobiia bacterium]|nr:maleylpyruvate isomerase family mycothiol-dependent enzyme [Acidimicrobiia bacterium]